MATVFMNLSLPTVTVTSGPEWASQLNTALETIDQHDHSSGKGTKITPAGLNINDNLSMGGNDLTTIRSTRYSSQDSPLSELNDVRCLYVSGGNLYYNNASGVSIQITSDAGLNASSLGGIGGDYGTSDASVTYSNSSKKYFFYQASGQTAFMESGAITIKENVTSANGITIGSPTSLGSAYSLTLPTGLPSAGLTKFLTVDSSGQVGAVYDVDDETIEISSNTIQVKDNGISRTQIYDLGYQISSSSGTFTTTSSSYVDVTNLSVTLTVTGIRPVFIALIPSGSGLSQCIGTAATSPTASTVTASLSGQFIRDATSLGVISPYTRVASGNAIQDIAISPQAFWTIDIPTAGTYTYKFQVVSSGLTGANVKINNVKLIAYEL